MSSQVVSIIIVIHIAFLLFKGIIVISSNFGSGITSGSDARWSPDRPKLTQNRTAIGVFLSKLYCAPPVVWRLIRGRELRGFGRGGSPVQLGRVVTLTGGRSKKNFKGKATGILGDFSLNSRWTTTILGDLWVSRGSQSMASSEDATACSKDVATATGDAPFIIAHKKASLTRLKSGSERVSVSIEIYNQGFSGALLSHPFELEAKKQGMFYGAPAVITFRIPTKAALQEAYSTEILPLDVLERSPEKFEWVRNDVLEKWKSMTDAENEPYLTRIKRVNSLIEHLKENEQLNVLKEMGYGSLIGVRDRPIRRELCRSLVEQFDVQQYMVKYGDYSFPLGVSCAAAVLGVENKGKSVVEVNKTSNWKALASKYDLKHNVTYAELEEEIKSGSYEGDDLKARVLLYLVGIFLCSMGDTSKSKDNMKLICDEGLKGKFNWAEYVHSRLIESIINFQKGHQRYFKGCIAILEVALFDFWTDSNSMPAYERTRVACIYAWGKEEMMRVMVKLILDRPTKQEREAVEEEEKEEEMIL
ncbi:GEM-like protein 5-like [Hibiscus syriacus]|uniref:GEM-like protein 5-like n=1 Tax=Hibiscus syriacus TaxID=106335 RepID=A0A6A2WPH1_HIBSY|nr:GEM-like protein 5-like [Hibiscus syriacus]